MRKIFLMLLMSMFLLSFTSAVAEITYPVYEGIIENNGQMTETLTGVEDFEVEGYICLDSSCATLGNEVDLNEEFDGNEVTLEYPTNLMNVNGYVVNFYDEGRIGWQQRSNWAGTGSAQGDDIYLSRIRTGYAPIQNMYVINEIHTGMPLEVNLTIGINADTYSAIKDTSVTGLDHEETVETEVLLEIFDDDENLIYTETKVLNIPYSESVKIEFDYTFTEVGMKEIKLTTDVTDAKVIVSLPQSSEAGVRVIEQGKTNYSYSIVNGLEMTPIQPKVNETVSFNIDYASKYVNIYGAVYNLGTDLEVIYTLDGNEKDTSTAYLAADGTYYFDYVFPVDGFWEVEVIGTPNPQLGNDVITDSRSLVFFVFDTDNNQSGNETTYSSTTLNNAEMIPLQPEIDETVSFNIDYASKYVDEDSVESEIGTDLDIVYYFEGSEVDSSGAYQANDGTYYFDYTFTQSGFWEVEVIGTPNPQNGDNVITDSYSFVFFVQDTSNNQTNVTYDYYAFLSNLQHTQEDLEEDDKYSFAFDYLFKNISSEGNISLMEGIVGFEIKKDGVIEDTITKGLDENGTYDYNFSVEEGEYSIAISICPVDNLGVIGHCDSETLTFTVGEKDPVDPDEPKKEKDWDDDSGFEFGPSVSINDGSYINLGKGSKVAGMPAWLYLIFLLLSLCLIILTCIVVILWMRKRNSERVVRA